MAEMKRASKRIVLVTERVNRYHFRVLVDGIDITAYEANPIMLWMHNRAFGRKDEVFLPLGNVIELKKETLPDVGYCLTGLPVFDSSDDFAMSIYHKYENGTIRMASAGLIPVEWSESEDLLLPTQRGATLVRSILEENSMVDIGADPNALQIALYNENHERITLSHDGQNAVIPLLTNPIIEIEMSKIELTAERAAVLLGLKVVPAVGEIETKIAEVVQLAHQQKTQIETLTKEKGELQAEFDKGQKTVLKEKTEVLLSAAVSDRKITSDERSFYQEQITDDASYTRVKLHLDGKKGQPSAKTIIEQNQEKTNRITQLCAKPYDELFANGELNEVKLNAPEEYKRIFKDKFGKEPKNV